MKSIKWKLIAMYLGLVLIVMIMSGTYIILSLQQIEVGKARSQLELYAEKISEQVVASYDEVDFQKGLEQFAKTSSSSQIQGNIINSDGETVASTTVSQPPFPEYKNSVIVSALSGQNGFEQGKRNADTSGLIKEWISYANPALTINGEVKYIVYTQMDASSMRGGLAQTRQTIVVAVMLALLLAVFMGYIFAKTLTEPIKELTVKAKKLAEGDLNQKSEVKSEDEIGQLTETFNFMATELNKTMGETVREKNKLEIILHNMTDGVISFYKNGELMHVNSASLEMLERDSFDCSFTQFIKDYDINSGVLFDVNLDAPKQAIFPVGRKYIKASFSPYSNEKNEMEGLVVVIQDITEQKKLEDMRKEFVANVSHELRTPLTTVKSYTETLMYGALDDRETAMEFLEIINTEADRMSFLVRDLLQLSRFDNKQIQLQLSNVNINEFVCENVRQNKIHAENKNQTLIFEPFSDNNAYIVADKDRITQVINNIITNAIKYSLSNAEIKVSVEEDENYYKIKVRDTGMGIQREDLPRIFERFYRVDKARSRAMGGTGLGLAIAKEIMESLGGKITVESEYGKGTIMTMCFLKKVFEPTTVEDESDCD